MSEQQKTELINKIVLSIQNDPEFKTLLETNVSFIISHASKFIKSKNPALFKHVEGFLESFLAGDSGKQKQSLVWGFVDALESILKPSPETSEPLKTSDNPAPPNTPGSK